MKYVVSYYDYENGATSEIDVINEALGYTAEQYTSDVIENANSDYVSLLEHGKFTLTPETLYIVTEGKEADSIYGDQYPVCMTEAEVRRLNYEFGTNLFEVLHEASLEEIKKYGISKF